MAKGNVYYWVANWNLSRAQARVLLGNDVVEMVDCLAGDLPNVVKCFPEVDRFAAYVTGTDGLRWTNDDFEMLRMDALAHGGSDRYAVARIDQSNSPAPLLADVKLCKDIESGASLVSVAVEQAVTRFRAGLDSTFYVEQSELTELEDAVERAGLPRGEIIGYQYASPLHTPDTMLPGSGLTIKEANCDLSVIRPEWLPLPAAASNIVSAGKTSGYTFPLSYAGDEYELVAEVAGHADTAFVKSVHLTRHG